MQRLLPILFQLILLFALTVGSAAAERKDRKPEPLPKPPPQPVEQALKVRRGEKLTIPLRIYGSQREALRFLIRKGPAAGKLSEPQPRDRESALVTYEPPMDLEVNRDQFSYAVQNSAGVSAAVDVVITIVDEPPVLVIPDAIDFGTILAGKSVEREIEIANRGGGMAAGELKVDAPWKIEGSTEYRLGAEESRKVKLVFTPVMPGPFRGELQFSSDKTRAVGLNGEAQAALAAEPPSVVLQTQSGDVVRRGAFELVNGTDEPQTVTFAENSRLKLPASVDLPPNGRAVVTVQTYPEHVGALAEEIQASGAGVEFKVGVNAKAVGAVLRKVGEQLDFGTVNPGAGAVSTIEVQNVGGAEGFWRWEALSPFLPAEQGFKLAPGERKNLMVRLDPAASGQYRAMLKLIGEQQTVEVLAEAIAPNPGRTGARGGRTSPPRPQSSVRLGGGTSTSRPAEDDRDAPVTGNVPLPSKVQELSPTRALVVWPARNYEGSYRLETRSLGFDAEGKLKVSWSPSSSAQVRSEGDQIVGEIDGLTPGAPHAFRLVNIPPGSDVGKVAGMVQFRTPVQEPVMRFTFLRGLFLLLATCLGIMAWRRFKRA